MKSINELGLDLGSVEVRKRVVDFLMGVNVEFKYTDLDSIDCRGKIIGYRNDPERRDFTLLILAVWDDFPFGWRSLDKFDNIIYGADSETKKVFANLRNIQISDILADADESDTIIYGADSETKKVFVHITDILISDILADTLVMFVKGKTISEPKVSNDWKVSKSYLSNSNGFKY